MKDHCSSGSEEVLTDVPSSGHAELEAIALIKHARASDSVASAISPFQPDDFCRGLSSPAAKRRGRPAVLRTGPT